MFFISLFLILTACTDNNVAVTADTNAYIQCATLRGHQLCDFDAIDNFNDQTYISDLYGKPIVLDLSAGWCGPCKESAEGMQALADSMPDVTFLTVLIENSIGDPPDSDDLNSWIANYGITTAPVWGSSREIISSDPLDMEDRLFLSGWPSFYFINSDGELQEYVKGYSESTILEKAAALN